MLEVVAVADESPSSAASASSRGRRRSARLKDGGRRLPFTVYLSREEREQLELRALATGDSIAKILVESALSPVTNTALDDNVIARTDMSEAMSALRGMRRDLEGVSTNLNQIAHHANTVSEVPADFAQVVARVRRTVNELNEILLQVRR